MKISKELKAGLIAIFALVSFIMLFQFMKGKNVFSTDNAYFVKYDNVAGLQQSDKVSINGLDVGQVDKISPIMGKDGKLHFLVKLSISDKFEFSKKSNVEIFEPSLMSGKALKLNLVYGMPIAQNGDTLGGGYQLSMIDNITNQVGPVKDQLQSVLKRVDSLTNNANKLMDAKNRAEIKALLANLNRTVTSFEGTSKQTNALLANNDPKIQKVLDNASMATVSAKDAIDKYGKVADNIDTQKLSNAIDKLAGSADKLNNVIIGIQNGEGSLGKLAKDEQLYNNLTKTSENLNKLIEDVKANPKRYINFSVFGKNNKD